MIRSTDSSSNEAYQKWIQYPTYDQRLQEWQKLTSTERNEIWTHCEKNDSNHLKELWEMEWQIAEQYFAKDEHKDELKMSHKNGETRHSFLKVKNGIFMLARKDKELGRGAFGAVKPTYLKGNEGDVLNKSGEQCIVKVIKTKDEDDEKAINKEAGALDAVGELYAKEERVTKTGQKKFYLVAKRHSGRELMDVILEKKLTYAQSLVIAYQCCELLESAHKRGYLHLDLKAENVMVDIKDGVIKVALIDWGLSEKLPEGKNEISIDNAVGTPGFIPPEMFAKNGKASKASDIYSLGVMFKNDLILFESDYSAILNYDVDKRASLAEEKQKLLKALDMLLDDEKDEYIKNFISQHPVSSVFNENDVIDVDIDQSWQKTTIATVIASLKNSFLGESAEEQEWIYTAKHLRDMIEDLTELNARSDLTDSEKLELVESALRKSEGMFFGNIKNILAIQRDLLDWNRDFNRVYDVFLEEYALMNDDQKEFFNKNIEKIGDAEAAINDDYSLTFREKSQAFKSAINDLIDFCIVNAIADPQYNDLVSILERAVDVFKPVVEHDVDNVDEMLAEMGILIKDNGKRSVEDLLDEMEANLEVDAYADDLETIFARSDSENESKNLDKMLAEMGIVIEDDGKRQVEEPLDEMEANLEVDAYADDLETIFARSDSENESKNLDKMLAEMGIVIEDDGKRQVEEPLDEMDALIEDDRKNDLEKTIDDLKDEAANEVKKSLQMPQFNQFVEKLIEFSQQNPDKKLLRIIEILQENIQRPYYQKNPKQCIDGVMAENNEPMETVEAASFLIQQLEPWEIETPKLHEQIQAYQNEQAEFAEIQEAENKKLAALKENIFDYAIYLFDQQPCLTDEALAQHAAIVRYIKNRKKIDYDNQGFVNNLLNLQKNKYDLQNFSDIQDDIKEVCEVLIHEYGIDLSLLSDRNLVKNVVLAVTPEEVVKQPLSPTPAEDRHTVDFNRFLKTDEAFLKEHAVVDLLLKDLRNNLAAKRQPSESAYVLEMNTLVRKIEMLPEEMPEKIKIGVIKSYLLSKEQELKNAKLTTLQNQLDSSVSKAIDYVFSTLKDVEWPEPSSQTEDVVMKKLSPEENAGIELFQRTIELVAENFRIVNDDSKLIWSEKPTNDDLAVISKQLQQKLDLIQEGIIKLDPQKELKLILKNASANHRLTKLVNNVASELNIELGTTEPVLHVVPNKEDMEQKKNENAVRAQMIEEIKKSWKELAESLVKKDRPDKNDHLAFSDERLKLAIEQLKKAYENTNPAKKHNLTIYVIPQLEKQFYEGKKQVIKHYIAYQKQNIEFIKAEHAKIRDKENELLKHKKHVLAKVNIKTMKEQEKENEKKKIKQSRALFKAMNEDQLNNAIAGLKKVVQEPKVVAQNPFLAEIHNKGKRVLPELPKASLAIDEILVKMQQVDHDLQREQQALNAAYNMIIAYDPRSYKKTIPFAVDQIIAKQRVVAAAKSEAVKRVERVAQLPILIDAAKVKAAANEAALQKKHSEMIAEFDAAKALMLKNIERSLAPISLEGEETIIPLPILPMTPVIAQVAEKLVVAPEYVSKIDIDISRPLPPLPIDIDKIVKEEIDRIQVAEYDRSVDELIEKHRDFFTLNDDDREIVVKLKALNQALNEEQRLAELEGGSLSELNKSLQAVEDHHILVVNDLRHQISEIQRTEQKEIDLLNKVLKVNLAKRKNDLAKVKELSSQLDAVLKSSVSGYQTKLKHQEQLFARKWFKHQAKSFGRRAYGKERSRTKQVKFIQDVFLGIQQDIPSSDIPAMKDKILIAYQCLAEVQKEILNEKNTFESDLFHVCDEQMKKLEGILNDLSAVSPKILEKPNFSEEAFLKMVFYKPRNASDQELPLELQMINYCRKYNNIPMDYGQYGNGGTLTMLEGMIKRQMEYIQYFAEFGQGPAKLEAIKLQAQLSENKEMLGFQEKSAERAKKMTSKKPKQTVHEILSGVKLQEHRKKMIDEKVEMLKRGHLSQSVILPKPKNEH